MSVPALPAEGFACAECGLDTADLSAAAALDVVAATRRLVEDALDGVTSATARPPGERTWSAQEYAAHLRDVAVTSMIRIHRARHEDDPTVDPMLNDLRSARLSYNGADLRALLDDLDRAVDGLLAEAARIGPDDWTRTVQRLPGERRSVLWLVRNAAHETRHHVRDIATLGC